MNDTSNKPNAVDTVNTVNTTFTDIVNNGIALTTEQAEKNKAVLKSALIMQARRELERVLKLTDMLDKIQEKYQDRVFDYINRHDDESAVNYLPRMIDVISQCLDRSQKMIHDIALDDKITNIMLVDASTNISNITNNTLNMDLSTAQSRGHVRDAVNAILKLMNTNIEETTDDVVDVDTNINTQDNSTDDE